MTYLDDNPDFHDSLLLEGDDALWLVPHDLGSWTLPTFVAEEQHTAEVERFGQHLRARYGLRVCVLGVVLSELDPGANRVRRAYLAQLGAGTLTVSGKPLDAGDMAVWCSVARALSTTETYGPATCSC